MGALENVIDQPQESHKESHILRDAFLGWQCRVRQHAMREKQGRPDDEIMPILTLADTGESIGRIITVYNKLPSYSLTPEFRHMAKKTHDAAQRREQALNFFSATYYQKPKEFSDTLTSCFLPNSAGAAAIHKAKRARLEFAAFGQQFMLDCQVWKLPPTNPLYQATWWHNHLFNPNLSGQAVILGFEPDWDKSTATPSPVNRKCA